MSTGHSAIITPSTNPSRFTPEEKALFDAGKCCWQVEYGTIGSWGPGEGYCGEKSKPGASFGHCADHDAEMLETCYPDGSPR